MHFSTALYLVCVFFSDEVLGKHVVGPSSIVFDIPASVWDAFSLST